MEVLVFDGGLAVCNCECWVQIGELNSGVEGYDDHEIVLRHR